MHPSVRAALLATLLATVAIPCAQAADITPDQAKALESQMSGWLQRMLGPNASQPDRPIQVTPEGDHYHVAVPIGVAGPGQSDPITITASARPLDEGRWAIEGPRIPSPSHFTLQMPTPPQKGQTTPGPTVPVDYTVAIGSQDSQGTYDPSFATPSTLTTSFRNLEVEATSAMTDQRTKVERTASTSTLRPSGVDRVDLIVDSTTEGYALRSKTGDNQPVEAAALRVRVNGEVTAVSRDRVAQIVPALMRITGGVAAGIPKAGSKAPAASPSIDPQLLRTVLQSLQDLASEFTLDETIDGAVLHYGPYGGTASQVRIGMGAKSDGGLLQAHMDLGLDGLALPDLSLGAMADLLPRKVALRPVLTGVPTQDLIQLLVASSNAKSGGPPPEFAALFRRGGVIAGLESFALDIGGASFAGMGKVMIASPQSLTGEAQVTATNFDDLMQRANAIPELAGVLPVFVFAKGIGRTVENRLVWDITYRDDKLLVNGTDLSAMAANRQPTRTR